MLPLKTIAIVTLCSVVMACNSTQTTKAAKPVANKVAPQKAQKSQIQEFADTGKEVKTSKPLPAGAIRFEMHETITSLRLLKKTGFTFIETDLLQGADGMYLMPGEYRAKFESSILVGDATLQFVLSPDTKVGYLHLDVSPDQKNVFIWYSSNSASSAQYSNDKLTQLCTNELPDSTPRDPVFADFSEEACNGITGEKKPEVKLALARIYQQDLTGKHSSAEIEKLLKESLLANDARAAYMLMNHYSYSDQMAKRYALIKQLEVSKEPSVLLLVALAHLENDNQELARKFALKSFENGGSYSPLILVELELRKLKPDYVAAEAWLQIFNYQNDKESYEAGKSAVLIKGKNSPEKAPQIEAKKREFLNLVKPEVELSVCLKGLDKQKDFKGKKLAYAVNSDKIKRPLQLDQPLHLRKLSPQMEEFKLYFYDGTDDAFWLESLTPKTSDSPHMCVVWSDEFQLDPQRYSNKNPADCTCSR